MIGHAKPAARGQCLALAAGILAAAWWVNAAAAQSSGPAFAVGGSSDSSSYTTTSTFAAPSEGEGIVQAGCSSCGSAGYNGSFNGSFSGGGCSSCGGGGGCPSCCYALRKKCDCCFGDGPVGKCLGGLYECICCPDPCYLPEWIPVANSAFFVDAARPVTQTRIRYDAGFNYTALDRGEYLMPRFKVPANAISMTGQAGPGGGATGNIGRGPSYIANSATIQNASIYQEAAIQNFSVFMEYFYNSIDPTGAPDSPGPPFHSSGFGDLTLGTKSLLLDCELLQGAFQFKTFIPTGNFGKGLGTGHVSLEPSALFAIKCTESCYVQAQLAYWIPIGGDSLYQSNIWHNHISINKILCKPCNDFQLIGTLEFNDYEVFQGSYTSSNILVGGVAPLARSATSGMFSMGPGLRCVICTQLDFGVGTAFALTGDHFAGQLIRSEFRYRY